MWQWRQSCAFADLQILVIVSVLWPHAAAQGKNRAWISPSKFIIGFPAPRDSFGFTQMKGYLYVFGGRNSFGNLNDLFRFDPSTLGWTSLSGSVLGVPPSPRYSFGMTTVGNKILVFGGQGTSDRLNDLHLLNPSKLAWTDLSGSIQGIPPSPRKGPGFACVAETIFVFAGSGAQGELNDMYSVDISTTEGWNTVTAVEGDPPSPRVGPGFTSAGGKIFVFGGRSGASLLRDLHCFDPSTKVWTELSGQSQGATPFPRGDFGFTSGGGSLFVFGGMGPLGYLSDLHSFDPSTLAWTDLTQMAQGSAPATTMEAGFVFADGNAYLFGGVSPGDQNKLHRLDTATLLWTDLSGPVQDDAPPPRGSFGEASLDGKIYFFGGLGLSDYLNDLFQFDPSTLAWTSLGGVVQGTPPVARYGHKMASARGSIFVFGGLSRSGSLGDLHRFNPSTLVWTRLSGRMQGTVPPARYGHGLTSAGGKLFVFAGIGLAGYLNDLHVFDPLTLVWTDLSLLSIGTPPSPRYDHGISSADGSILVFGGYTEKGLVNDLFMLQTTTLQWSNISNQAQLFTPAARAGHGMTSVNNKVFVFGGFEGNWGSGSSDSGTYAVSDLWMLDMSKMSWTDLTLQVAGESPPARHDHCLTFAAGMLFVFGGWNVQGTAVNDLVGLFPPAEILWSSTDGADLFIQVYDWDLVLLENKGSIRLDWQIALCVGIFPCSLSLNGGSGVVVSRQADGRISCYASSGCVSLSIQSLVFSCDGDPSPFALLEVDGVVLRLYNSSFTSCASQSDGSAVQSYGNSSVTIEYSNFQSVRSFGSGGAISFVGGTLQVSHTNFSNCGSEAGGGAISASAFYCSGWTQGTNTTVSIDLCNFQNCESHGPGGAIVMTGASVNAKISRSSFERCTSNTTGGAISINDGASMAVKDSSFQKNTANGLGGGALHSQNAAITLQDINCRGNAALLGGGGVLYWTGSVWPKIQGRPACSPGSMELEALPLASAQCQPCSAGAFQTGIGATACDLCPQGKYSMATGATTEATCISCDAGKFSSIVGANSALNCSWCEAGKYSATESSPCSICTPGTYSSLTGGTTSNICVACSRGMYSTVAGAVNASACAFCEPGSFTIVNGATTCSACSAGTYVSVSGAAQCASCGGGTYSNTSGATSSAACSLCEKGTFSTNKIFQFFAISTSWAHAEADCVTYGGHLASIENEADNQAILNMLPSGLDFWIGLYRNTTTGEWTWADGSDSKYTNWANSNPKNGSELFDCADFPSYAVEGNRTGMLSNWPWFQEEYAFAGLEAASTSYSLSAGGWYNYDCENGNFWMSGYICSFAGSSSCQTCDEGTYSTIQGSSSSASCVLCPVGQYSSSLGSSSCTTCSGGTYSTSAGQTSCQGSNERRNEPPNIVGKRSTIQKRADLFSNSATVASTSRDPSTSKNPVNRDAIRFASIIPDGGSAMHEYFQHHNGRDDAETKDSHVRVQSPERNLVAVDVRNDPAAFAGTVCEQTNSAAYGPCIATSYVSLKVMGLPTLELPAYPGLAITVLVMKLDAYNQTIVTDSSTILQTQTVTSLNDKIESNSALSVSGTSIVSFLQGSARLALVLKPAFSQMQPALGLAQLYGKQYIYFQGLDSQAQTVILMKSDVFEMSFTCGEKVCPAGYILLLESSTSEAFSTGSCSRCPAGKYSISPLAGYAYGSASCLNCPLGAVSCPGGSQVQFSVGDWMVSGGIYILTSCPSEYQLINSIDGIFSHDVQNCKACSAGDYIISSNMSNITCQDCPTGAMCSDGKLFGLLPGSKWAPNFELGIYVLVSCPPGYVLMSSATINGPFSQSDQHCSLCPAAYYCTGGSSPAIACQGGQFSRPGSNSSSDCIQVVYVHVTITLPFTKANFTADKQDRLMRALASAAGTSEDRVIIVSITATRRSGQNAIQIASTLAADNAGQASSWSNKLDSTAVDYALARQNLPQSMALAVLVGNALSSQPPQGLSEATIVGVIVGALAASFLLCGGALWFVSRQQHAAWMIQPEELKYDDPPVILGRGTFGLILKAEYRGTAVAVKQVVPKSTRRRSTDDKTKQIEEGCGVEPNATAQLSSQLALCSAEPGATLLRVECESAEAVRPSGSSGGVDIGNQRIASGPHLEISRPRTASNAGPPPTRLRIPSSLEFVHTILPGGRSREERRHWKRLRRDFIAEMSLVSKLRHPSIITVMGAVVHSKEPKLVMELMHHGSLFDLLHNESVLLEGDIILNILQDVVQGMRFLHAAKPPIIHGDLKACNILVNEGFKAKVADFGLSQKRKAGVCGTPLWMAPELLAGGLPTCESDIYAFGITIYEVFSRKVPFEDEPVEEVLAQVKTDPKKRPKIPQDCPASIEAMMTECWAHDPRVRPTFEALDCRMSLVDLTKFTDAVLEKVQHRRVQTRNPPASAHLNDRAQRASLLLHDVFPRHVAEALMAGRRVEPEAKECVTIFFCDIVGFTTVSAGLEAEKVSGFLDRLYHKLDALSYENGVFKVDIIGDAWMGVTNLVEDQSADHVARMARFAIGALRAAGETLLDLDNSGLGVVRLRGGFHSGPAVANVLGTRSPRYSVYGDTVNTASRMESSSVPGRIQCSARSAELLMAQAPDIPLTLRGEVEVKGKGRMVTYWVGLTDPPALPHSAGT